MASAQVLQSPEAVSSKKKEHLEAGKRRLEEFRKKKAAKKATVLSQTNAPVDDGNDNQSSASEGVKRFSHSDGTGTSNGHVEPCTESSAVVINHDNNPVNSFRNSQQTSSNDTSTSYPFPRNDYEAPYLERVQPQPNDQESNTFGTSKFADTVNVNNIHEMKQMDKDSGIYTGSLVNSSFRDTSEQSTALHPQRSQEVNGFSSQSRYYQMDHLQLRGENNSVEKSTVTSSSPLDVFSANITPQRSGGIFQTEDGGFLNQTTNMKGNSYEGVENYTQRVGFNDYGGRKLGGFITGFDNVQGGALQPSQSTGFNSDIRSSFNQEPSYSAPTENNIRRSRPSFLDSLNVSRGSSGSPFQSTESDKESFLSTSSKLNGRDSMGSTLFQKPSTEMEAMGPPSEPKSQKATGPVDNSLASVSSVGSELFRMGASESSMERRHEFHSSKQNDDFSALEQHIEDLTQEKFSLKRALEASRALAESLASENSSLTDTYNQQRGVVNQLKSGMESLEEEIRARLGELESVKLECANAQLECNASDERAKLLASEVIGLEEKALRLRSSELKLERQLENLQAETNSYKKKMYSLEKERHDFQSTIEALQEEKKMLQSKLRKASASGISIDLSKGVSKREMSTSTEDLDASTELSNVEVQDAGNDSSGILVLSGNAESLTDVSFADIPPNQMRMIQNITTLISELALEKEELIQALASESSQSSRLKELNKELSRKLEAQTQKLELLIAQSMAGEKIQARQPDSRTMHEDTTTYADEGDEVVERVLGWIMKLFPEGPSKRRTSKLL